MEAAISITEWADERRRHLRRLWGSVAPGWAEPAAFAGERGAGGGGERAAWGDEGGAAVPERLLDLPGPRPGERVLELACGPGGVGLAAARLVGPDGQGVLCAVV